MNDVKSQSRSALAAPGREKWVEGLVADLIGHSDSVVGNDHLNMFGVQGTGLDGDASSAAVGKGMRHAIKKKVCDHLAIGTGVAVHQKPFSTVDGQGDR